MKGWVYVLTNPCMPGIVKIGKTTRDPELRAQELYTTGVPTPFDVHFSAWTFDINRVESGAHKRLGSKRIANSREFFREAADAASFEVIEAHEEIVSEFLEEFAIGQYLVSDGEVVALERINNLIEIAGVDKSEGIEALIFLTRDQMLAAVEASRDFELHMASSDGEEGHYQ